MQVQQLKVVGIEQMDGGNSVKLKLEGRAPGVLYTWMAFIHLSPSDAAGIGFGQTFEIKMVTEDETRLLADQEIERLGGYQL